MKKIDPQGSDAPGPAEAVPAGAPLFPPLSRRRRREIASLAHKKYREQLGELLVEGERSVVSALLAQAPLVEVVFAEGVRPGPALTRLLAGSGVPCYTVPADEMDRLSEVQTSQGVLGVARAVWQPIETLDACRTVVALDGVQDPGNAGTILRTAAWFGADAVLAGAGTVDLLHPKVVRAAMGGLWDVRLYRTAALEEVVARLRRGGFACYGADLEGVASAAWQPRVPSVLVFGSEAHGLSAGVAAALDARVRIEGADGRQGAESLNVAVAAGILLYEWLGRMDAHPRSKNA